MKYIFGIAMVLAVIIAGWKILGPEITNLVFQDDLQDVASGLGWRIGLTSPTSDDDIRKIVIRKAAKYEIELNPKHVTVRRSGTPDSPSIFIAADYTVPVDLFVYSLTLHFHPTSQSGKF